MDTPADTATTSAMPKANTVKAEENTAPRIDINFSGGLASFLAQENIALAFTSYQSGRLYLVGHEAGGKLALHEAHYPQAMGVAGDHRRIYLGTLTQLVRLENVLSPDQIANEKHDKVYVPRNMQTLGAIDFHEVGIRDNGVVVFVNTRYSCLCEPSLTHSFKPVWKPPFISKLGPRIATISTAWRWSTESPNTSLRSAAPTWSTGGAIAVTRAA